MKLYFAAFSPPARCVLMVIRLLELDVEIIHVDFAKGENKSEDFTKLNPLQQVPVLVDDDGFILTESRAIAAYLIASRDPKNTLYPLNDPIKRALCDEKLYYDATIVFFSHIQILHPMIAASEPQVPDDKREILRNVLTILNGFLEGRNWLVGDNPTIADIAILSNLIVILSAGVRINNFKNLSAWFERCKELKGFEENYEGGKMVTALLKVKNLPPVSL